MPNKDPEAARIYQLAYSATHRKEACARAAIYHAAHRENELSRMRAYRLTHRDQLHAAAAIYRADHREEARVRQASIPERRREIQHRRRARIRGQFVAPVDVAAIYRRDRGRCHICGKHVKRVDVSMDHLVPISLGGVHAPWNVGLAHRDCNRRRFNTGPAQLLLIMEA